MSRRIVTEEYQAAGVAGQKDDYVDRILKYIPSDIVAGWLFLSGLILSVDDKHRQRLLLWIVFVVLIPLTVAWTLKQTRVPNKPPAWTQTAIATGSFVVWVFAIGGPFATLSWYDTVYGSIVLVLYTISIGLVTPAEG
jgi:hypothetical protein